MRKYFFALFLLFIFSFFFNVSKIFAATYSWNQTDWTGGVDDSGYAKHSTDQLNWNKFLSKDVGITVQQGLITLTPIIDSLVHNSSIGFTSATLTNVEIGSSGVQLKMLTGVKQIESGQGFYCVLKSDSTVWCWGLNDYGQLGVGYTVSSNFIGVPVQVKDVGDSGFIHNVQQISANLSHVCALKTDGTVWCWGDGSNGELGNNAASFSYTPVQVVGLGGTSVLSSINKISVGYYSNCALRSDAAVVCWGKNNYSQLGIGTSGTTSKSNFPVQVKTDASNFLTSVKDVGVGAYHVCVVKTDGTAWCWGRPTSGQLGNGNKTNTQSYPSQVRGSSSCTGNYSGGNKISVDGNASCVVSTSNYGYCWGENSYGQSGIGNITSYSCPNQVINLNNSFNNIYTGGLHTCSVLNTNSAYCWGYNPYGGLGTGSTVSYTHTPTQVKDVGGSTTISNVDQIAVGLYDSCALKTDGTVYCWGSNNYGQVGINNNNINYNTPIQTLSGKFLKNVNQIGEGQQHSCSLKNNGTVWCWGTNNYGQLGIGNTANNYLPVQVKNAAGNGFLENINQINNKGLHTCAVKTDNTAWCWGYNNYGQLGIGNTNNNYLPVQVLGAGGTGFLNNIDQINVNGYHTCAVKTDDTAWCWGYNNYGQLGIGNTNNNYLPVQVLGAGGTSFLADVNQISIGSYNSCVVKNNNTVWCWGHNTFGQLGTGNTTISYNPVQVLGAGGTSLLTNVSQVDSSYHTCAIKTDNTVWCWGRNSYGQLGIGTTDSSYIPVQVKGVNGVGSLSNVTQIITDVFFTCALKTDGTVWCWGVNNYGQLGIGTTGDSYTPVQVLGINGYGFLENVVRIGRGNYQTCAVKADGTSLCWGHNQYGQLGNNTVDNSLTPVYVLSSDSLNLNSYNTSGTLLSSVLNLNNKTNLTKLSIGQTLTNDTTIKFQLKTSNTEIGLSSADWFGSDGTSSTYFTANSTDIATTLNQYIQYQAILETDDSSNTSFLNNLTLDYNNYSTSSLLISSPFDTEVNENLLSQLSWIKSTPDNTNIKFQLRTASTQNGLSTADWKGPDGTSSTFFTNNIGETTNSSQRDGSADRWFQYKTILESDGLSAPTLYDITSTYVVNAPPSFDPYYQTNGFGITGSVTPGIFNFLYSIGDTDTSSASTDNQYKLWPTFQYTLDNGGTWTTIVDSNLTGPNSSNPLSLSNLSLYTTGVSIWNAAADLLNSYNTVKIRMIINDHEAANNTATITSDAFIIDTKAPTVGTPDGGGSGININRNVTTSLALDKTNNRNVTLYFSATDDSSLQMKISTDSNFTGASYQNYASSVGYTLPVGDGSKRIYVKFKDYYGNESASYSDVIELDTTGPNKPSSMFIQDISNAATNEMRTFVNWAKSSDTDWSGYKLYKSTNGIDFNLLQTITNINTNYVLDTGVTSGVNYIYKITAIDDLSNESIGNTVSQTIGGNPSDAVAPTIANIQKSNKTTSSINITWTTDEVSNSTVLYSTDTNYGNTQGSTGYSKNHSVTLTGLSAGTTYNFKVRSSDGSGNATDSTADSFTTDIADDTGPIISGITTDNITVAGAEVQFTTNELASSFVEYATTTGFTSGNIVGLNDSSLNHSVSLKSLSPSTVYYYKVRSLDSSGNETISAEKTFTTSADTADKTGPVISSITISNIQYNTATIGFTSDENSSSFIEFGKTTSYGRIYGEDENVTTHSVTLPYDLKPETLYYYRIRTKDISGNETIGVGKSFTTDVDPNDLIAPTISNVEIGEAGKNSVTVTWDTNEVSNSYLGYSEDLSYAQEQGNPIMTTSHSITLVGLKAKTQYYFRVKSTDPSSNLSIDNNDSQGYSFVTADGDNPPTISANQIRNVGTSSAEIYWETNTFSNSYVEYGTDESYGNWAGLNNLTDTHVVTLKSLLSGVTYSFRVRSKTATGSEAVSQNYTLTTMGIAVTTPAETEETDTSSEEQNILDKIKNGTTDFLKKVLNIFPDTDISESDFTDALSSMSPKIVSSPTISSGNITVDPGVDKITISWNTDKKSNSIVAYAADKEYDSTKANPYTTEVGNNSESVTSHSVEIVNLNPNTTYHYQVKSKSEFGNWTKSSDFTFTTLSINSEIKDFKFNEIGQKLINASWQTNFESRAMIEIIDILSNKTIVKSEEQGFNKSHNFKTTELQTSTNYQMKIITVAKDGTVSEASIYPFSTSTSSQPPEISNVRISNALISNTTEQVQTIISWKTDKPSSSRIIYDDSSSKELKLSTSLDKSLVTDHIVVTTVLKPGKVYKFKTESTDASGNTSISKDFIIMTPKTQESVIDLIVNNLTQSFSFLGKKK